MFCVTVLDCIEKNFFFSSVKSLMIMILNAVERILEISFFTVENENFSKTEKLFVFVLHKNIRVSCSFVLHNFSLKLHKWCFPHFAFCFFFFFFSLRRPSENVQTIALSTINGREWRTSFQEQRNHVLFASHYAYSFFLLPFALMEVFSLQKTSINLITINY